MGATRVGADGPTTAANAPGQKAPLVPTLDLPKGGGALRGLDEQVTTNPVTGTAAFTIALPLPAARGTQPDLALSYDSGAGNGPFGAGMTLTVPSITRARIDKGVPRYDDTDTFMLTGEDDLVPYLRQVGEDWLPDERADGEHRVRRYRPRTETSFARIEHWWHAKLNRDHWRVVTADNVTLVFGTTPEARLADPSDPRRIYRWSLTERRDDRGNLVRYGYAREDADGVDLAAPGEQGRARTGHYLKVVHWGNLVAAPAVEADWVFKLVFDYGDHRPTPALAPDQRWPARADSFSTYRSGFEIRAHRLCHRVLLFHHVVGTAAAPGLGAEPVLVSSLAFDYDHDPALTHLTRIVRTGHGADGPLDFPATELTWTQGGIEALVRTIDDPDHLRNLPAGIDGATAWVDLRGDGLAGALYQSATGWLFKRNLGAGRMAPLELLADAPVPGPGGDVQFADPEHRGQTALVTWSGATAGYRYRGPGGWEPLRPFDAVPVRGDEAQARFLDVDGDGLADLVITEDEVLRVYPSLGARGFGPGQAVPYPTDAGGAPTFVWSDRDQSIFLADMTGDGLTDVVRIRNGAVCYWPNLGHGRFGARVVMGDAPVFDHDLHFDPLRVRLADLDGSGPSDLVYLGAGVGGVRVWRNLAGNRWAAPEAVSAAPLMDTLVGVAIVDLEADGTSCLVWSAGHAVDGRAPIRYVRLSSGRKPHLLETIDNRLGLVTRFTYRASTVGFIDDEQHGRPWGTRLPFPVHVVEQVEHVEQFTGTRSVTRYAYHHGAWDPLEREFRGFGMVEQTDADEYEEHHRGQPLIVPARRTKSWFHPGVLGLVTDLDAQFRREWTAGLPVLAPHELPVGVAPELTRAAMRALKGRALREEVFGDDLAPQAHLPFAVTQHRLRVRVLQPAHGAHPACFAVEELEALAAHTERTLDDIRLAHTLNLDFDAYGHVLASAAIAYPRAAARRELHTRGAQGATIAVYSQHTIGNLDAADGHRLGVPIESSTWALPALAVDAGELVTAATVRDRLDGRRLLAAERALYQAHASDDAPLPLGSFGPMALPYESYQLAFTSDHLATLAAVLDAAPDLLEGRGGYRQQGVPGVAPALPAGPGWWIPSGRTALDADNFFQPKQYVDPFGNEATPTYDEPTRLLLASITDARGNVTRATTFDYRHMQPVGVEDANGNLVELRLDARGVVVATAVRGTEVDGVWSGDTLDAPTERFAYQLTDLPASSHRWSRTAHRQDRFEETVTYFDGHGRPLAVKHSAEPGPAQQVLDGTVVTVDAAERWIGSGRVVRDNKGEPVKQYEPYYATSSAWDDEPLLDAVRPSSLLVRDALGRVIRTEHLDGSFARVVRSPWHEEAWDEHDNASSYLPTWAPVGIGALAEQPGHVTSSLPDSPTVKHLDPLGRAVLVVADDQGRTVRTFTALDVLGSEREVTSPIGLAVRARQFDLAKRAFVEAGVDDGAKRVLLAADGKPLAAVTANRNLVETEYDELRRVIAVRVTRPDGSTFTAERHTYGDDPALPLDETARRADNLRGRVIRTLDAAGEVTFAYDFHGNADRVTRRLFVSPAPEPDVDGALAFSAHEFVTRTSFDALGRAVAVVTAPDPRVQRREFGRDGRLARVTLGDTAAPERVIVKRLVHEANGQRTQIEYGNGVVTRYEYDERMRRLVRIVTTAGSQRLQDVAYCYDAVGNITSLDDRAQPVLYYANQEIRARATYRYDGLYRLTEATGREHSDQAGGGDQRRAPDGYAPVGDPDDPQRLRMYTQRYAYDDAGNILSMRHDADRTTQWTRLYRYAYQPWHERDNGPQPPAGPPPETPASNRLLATGSPDDVRDPYAYDLHGNMTAMPGLPTMAWDWREAMVASAASDGGTGVEYACDAGGQRMRKVWHGSRDGATRTERVYLGALEVYREYKGDLDSAPRLVRWTVHVMDDERRVYCEERDEGPAAIGTLCRYQLDDHLGSSRLELGAEGVTGHTSSGELGREDFHPYGTTAHQAAAPALAKRPKRYRYTAMERDTETGLQLHGVRYYAPWLARWTSPDPLVVPNGVVTYEYCRGQPTASSDASGYEPDPRPKRKPAVVGNVDWDLATGDLSNYWPSRQRPAQTYHTFAEGSDVHVNMGGVPDVRMPGFVVILGQFPEEEIVSSLPERLRAVHSDAQREMARSMAHKAYREARAVSHILRALPVSRNSGIKIEYIKPWGGGIEIRRDAKGNVAIGINAGYGIAAGQKAADVSVAESLPEPGPYAEFRAEVGKGPVKLDAYLRAGLAGYGPSSEFIFDGGGSLNVFGIGGKLTQDGLKLKGGLAGTRIWPFLTSNTWKEYSESDNMKSKAGATFRMGYWFRLSTDDR